MSNFMGVGIFWIGLNRADLGCWRLTLRPRGIMIGRQFHANMKVQTTTCKDNNNSKSRAATCVKFDINIK